MHQCDAPEPGPLDTNGENLKRYNAIITVVNGFGAEPSPTMKVLSDLMNQWSQSSHPPHLAGSMA